MPSDKVETKKGHNTGKSKDTINEYIWDETKGIVQSGPFKGMQLIKEEVWNDGNLGTKCIGCYETEVHEVIEVEIERLSKLDNPKIVNIGCAEGFYAVGMALRLPKAKIDIIDIDDKALELAHKAAAANDVTLTSGSLLTDILPTADFIISDCEGAEIGYLNPEAYPGIERVNMLVECHDFEQQHTTEMLVARFNETHKVIYTLSEACRVPNNYEFLIRLPSHSKWLAISEGRPSSQYYLYMSVKDE